MLFENSNPPRAQRLKTGTRKVCFPVIRIVSPSLTTVFFNSVGVISVESLRALSGAKHLRGSLLYCNQLGGKPMLKNEQAGMLTWTENGKVIRRKFTEIVTFWPDGTVSDPVSFHGQILLSTGTTPRVLQVFRSYRSRAKRKALWQEIAERLSWCMLTAGLMLLTH